MPGSLAIRATARPFFASMIVIRTPRGDDMFMQMLGSASEHIVENRALEALGV